MNKYPELQGYIRAFLASFSGVLVSKGYLSADQYAAGLDYTSGLILLALVALWSHWSNKLSTMVSMVADNKKVQAVVTVPDIAHADPSPKVVPNNAPGAQAIMSTVTNQERSQ